MENREYARLETYRGEPVMLEGVRAVGDLKGLMLEMKLEQRFRNPTDKNVEVVYTFPLPWGAVLLGVEVQLGDKRLTGAVVEKKQAEAEYEEALSEGNAAIMLEKNRDRSYSLNLGNLNANEACIVKLRYAQLLQFEQGGLRVMIPTVIAPRFGDAVTDGGLQPHQTPKHDLLAEYPFDISLRLHGDLARGRVASPSHPIGVSASTDVLTVSLARCGALDRDFVLVVDQLTQYSIAVIAQDSVLQDHVVALASFCPRVPVDASQAVAVKLLVDCSGSMAGDSIAAARRALHAIVDGMGQGDRFSLSRFGTHVEHRSRGLWAASDATRVAAQRWVSALEADLGGTEMEEALKSTFALAQTVTSDVLIVTDGEISAIDQTIASAKSSGHRVFVVGIGSSPAESHLRRLAEATGGACDFVAPGEAVEPAVLRMFARLRSPRLTDLSVVWPAGLEPVWATAPTASIFDGDTVSVFALLKHPPIGEVRLMGARAHGDQVEQIGQANFDTEVEATDTLARMAAFSRIQFTEPDWLVGRSQEMAQIAVAYQLVTEQTNFLLVHVRAEEEKPADMPDQHQVAHMAPAGWGGLGSITSSRRGAFFETRVVEYLASGPLDWGDTDAPAVARCVSTPGYLDIPAFLRKSIDREGKRASFDRSDPKYWICTKGYDGLTPFGLSEWLRAMPMNIWPKTYDDLREVGLGTAVIDWLELVVSIRDGELLPEQTVVEAFLYVMSQRDIRELLVQPHDVMQGFKGIAQRLKGVITGSLIAGRNVDTRLVEEILAALESMSTGAWPDGVYALAAADGCLSYYG